MKKSVYSLVLMDDVVKAIDQLAYERNTNRSGIINHILAESVNYITPEMRIQDIFSQLEDILSNSCYQFLGKSNSMLACKSQLRYKYQPVVNYSIELFREPLDIVGQLKVSFRTSSKNFMDELENFFTRWMYLENIYLRDVHASGVPAEFKNSRYTRGFLELSDKNDISVDETASAIGEYIRVIDKCIKFYFEHIENEELIEKYLQDTYRNYLASGVHIA